MAHEIMHTLGFYHEHAREDRDKYIFISYLNVKVSFRIAAFSKVHGHEIFWRLFFFHESTSP